MKDRYGSEDSRDMKPREPWSNHSLQLALVVFVTGYVRPAYSYGYAQTCLPSVHEVSKMCPKCTGDDDDDDDDHVSFTGKTHRRNFKAVLTPSMGYGKPNVPLDVF